MHRNSAMNQYTVGEVASRFHVTDKTVAKWIQSGALIASCYPNEKPAYLISKEAINMFEDAYRPYLDKPRGRGCEVIPRKVLKQKALEAANMEKHDVPEITEARVDDDDITEIPTFYTFEEEHHPYDVVEYHDGDKFPNSREFIEFINCSFRELADVRKKLNEMDKDFIEVWNAFINQWFDDDSDARSKFVRLMHESPNYKQLSMEFDTMKDTVSARLKDCGINEALIEAMVYGKAADYHG